MQPRSWAMWNTLQARIHDLERHAHTGEAPRANPVISMDEAFDNWRAIPWSNDKLNEYFATAPVEWHRALTEVMEQSFRAGWAVCLAGGSV
jgi:hypothetical protein